MTGRSPGHHGVFDFFRMESRDSRLIRFATSSDVACETIWSAASRQQRRVTTLNFPLMFPAPRIEGHVVAGWVPWKQLRLACHPEGLFSRLQSLPGFDQRELAMDIKLEERATEGCANADEYAPWIELHIRREQHWLEILEYLMDTEPSDLTAVLFDGVDKLQHLCWRFIDAPADAEWQESWERRAFELCREYFRRLDGIIERICSRAGPEARIFIASDHGFGPTRQVFHVNAWLERQGYLAWSNGHGANASDPALLGVGRVARHTFQMDWTRTRAFATTPTSNGIYITELPGVSKDECLGLRERIADELRRLRHPETGQRVVRQLYTREEAFAGPFSSMAPDLTLELHDGGLVSILPCDHVFSARPTVAGAHRPVGVFLAKGPGIQAGATSPELSILDVAPAVLYSLGLEVGEDLEGAVPESIFETGVLEMRPVKRASGAGAPARVMEPVAALDADQEAIVMRRLQELGYVE
jgi:predicted AlkP superfamily phosphohydrolase/phosphomutase